MAKHKLARLGISDDQLLMFSRHKRNSRLRLWSLTRARSHKLANPDPAHGKTRWLTPLASALFAAAIALTVALSPINQWTQAPPIDMPTSPMVLDRNGRLLRALPVDNGRWRLPVELDSVDPLLVKMLLMWEDRRFFAHHGVDWIAMIRALSQLIAHQRIVSGGSTLTMQLARLLEERETRSILGKWQQITSALALERHASKPDILRAYLQRAGYGGNLEGVRSASLAYFGQEPVRLTAAQAALLVALPQSPEHRRPDRHPEVAQKARDRVLMRALDTGLLDLNQVRTARMTPVPKTRRDLPRLAAHRADHWAARFPDLTRLHLTIDASLQQKLEQLAKQRSDMLPAPVSIAIMVLDHATGEVLASVGSAEYTDTSRDGFIDMTEAIRSPGSTLKPLIYGIAFELGLAHPETLIEDRPRGFGHYAPANFSGDFAGTVTIREALRSSLNVPAVVMLEHIGTARLLSRLRRAGADPQLPGDKPAGLAIALGGIGLRLRDLVAVYAAIARGGEATPIRELIPNQLGTSGQSGARHGRVLDDRAAWSLGSILSGADARGSGANAIAVKTGTSFGYRDAWALGFDGQHVAGVWVGRADGAPVSGLTGAASAVPILTDVFARLGRPTPFPPAPPGTLQASNGQLPAPLRRIESTETNQLARPVQIAYPPDGATIELAFNPTEPHQRMLILKARGGQTPLTWIINDQPLAREPFARTSQWPADGSGYVRIVLIDATGATDSARVFIESDPATRKGPPPIPIQPVAKAGQADPAFGKMTRQR